MEKNERFVADILINNQQAESTLKKMQKDYEALQNTQKRLYSSLKKEDKEAARQMQSSLDDCKRRIQEQQRYVQGLGTAVGNVAKSSYKELSRAVKALQKELRSGHIEKHSREWDAVKAKIRECRAEMMRMDDALKVQKGAWSRFIGFLNTNWGAFVQIFSTLSFARTSIRKSVQDFADLEEAMADTRKYTGLTDEAIRDLNEDLKKMDTRTSVIELNELAGAAGRLGKTSKKDILDFVEAGNMIKVALGDDLGEGAIDKVGKLAMAFGEDDKMGLRGAMLATGSAVNELAQNSSAQAGYLVDFTARVAGFGKQLGLTQAQIMGFGAVMDENMLRDEMAATAFGNMLTKMQTDTGKFARIAGMDIKKFTDLLNKDANAAILALADNLKKADPQTMMKMLDDMGLDGSRAVGVLSTLADKIDDVRARQELATKAYSEGTSVQKEYNTMNNTTQAGIEKAKKQFLEMSVALGERLQPAVKMTISGASMFIRVLNVLTGFVAENWKALLVLTTTIIGLTAAWNANTLSVKASNVIDAISIALTKTKTVVLGTLKQALMAARIAVAALSGNYVKLNWLMTESNRLGMANPWVALATVIVTVGFAIWGATEAWQAHRKELQDNLQAMKELRAQQQIEKDVRKQVAESTAEERLKVEQLTKVIRSNAYSVEERKKAIGALQRIVPDYHASISKEGRLFNENSTAIAKYIQHLNDAAMAEAIYAKKVELNKKKLDNKQQQDRIKGSLKAVQAERDAHPDQYKSQKVTMRTATQTGYYYEHTYETNQQLLNSQKQEQIHNQRLETNLKEEKVLESQERWLNKQLETNQAINREYTKRLTQDTTTTTSPTGGGGGTYTPEDKKKGKKSSDDEKKERREHLQQLREAAREEKAVMDSRLSDNMLAYSAGLKGYRKYIADQQRIREEGLKAQMEVWKDEPAEYEKLRLQLVAIQKNGDEELKRMKLEDMEREHEMVIMKLKASFEDENSTYFQNEEVLNEALFQADMVFLEEKKKLYREGSYERMRIEEQIQMEEYEHMLHNERNYQELLREVKTRYLKMTDKERETQELNSLEFLYRMGLLKEIEYQRAKMAIRAQYADGQTEGEKSQQAGANAFKVAQSKAKENASGAADLPIIGTISLYASTMQQLKEMYKNDEISYGDYMAAKQQATDQFCQNLTTQMQAAFDSVNSVMNAASNYYSAQSDYEVAVTKKKYEKQIAAAGNNQRRVKQLQEKQAKEEAAIKTKYNRKALKIQIAQALAQTAMNAINAYGSAAAIPVIGYIMAPIAAAMAVAAGALQIAALKKQQAAQEAGYYEGGFTGGKRYRKEAGVVHEGEFVANHQAVENPNILPLLDIIDRAQRNNTVGSLTQDDIARQLGYGSQTVAPVITVNTDNPDMLESAGQMTEAAQQLKDKLSEPFPCFIVLDGPDGLVANLKKFENLTKQ